MEKNEVSIHEVKIWLCLMKNKDKWMTNKEVSSASDMNARTVRLHTKRLSDLGIVDCAEVFPGHRYRISGKADKRNSGYDLRLKAAADVFGLK